MMILSLLLAFLSVRPAAAATSDAAFSAAARTGLQALDLHGAQRSLARDWIERALEERLGWYGMMEAQPSFDQARMSALISSGIQSRAYGSLILGETHGVAAEQTAAAGFFNALVDQAAKGGAPIGAFLQEAFTTPDTSVLRAHGVTMLTYKNQFAPEDDVKAALARAGKGVLISYTGSAHASQHTKDYFQNVLLASVWAGYGPGLKDMPTVEDSLVAHGRTPLIVAMITEACVIDYMEPLFLNDLTQKSATLAQLRENLEDLRSLWAAKLSAWPRPDAPIAFRQDPSQPNVYLGITPGDHSLPDLAALSQVLAMPELAAWLGDARIKNVESLAGSSQAGGQKPRYFWNVIVQAPGRPDFTRTIQGPEVLSAESLAAPQTPAVLHPAF